MPAEAPSAWVALEPAAAWLGSAALLDPDDPGLRYGIIEGRWEGMGGASTVLLSRRGPQLSVGWTFDGFIELVAFTDDYPVPWQSYRASFGSRLLLQSETLDLALPGPGRSWLDLSWEHESDHAADSWGWVERYGRSGDPALDLAAFPNGWFSSFEYLRLRLGHRQDLGPIDAQLVLMGRRDTPSIADGMRGTQRGASADLALRLPLGEHTRPYVQGYLERSTLDIKPADFQAAERWDLDQRWLRVAEVGLELEARSGWRLMLHGTASHSHGRGVDFFEDKGPGLGGGLKLWAGAE